MKVFIAGVYYGDKSISLGAFTHKDAARSLGKVAEIHNSDLCSFVKEHTVDDFSIPDVLNMVDLLVKECDEVSA